MNTRIPVFTLTTFLILLGTIQSATIYVPDDYSTIQEAIDAAVNGDTVIVRPGTYVENIDFIGKAITVQSEQGSDYTIIDGGSPTNPDLGSVVLFQNGESTDSVLEGFTLRNGTGTYFSAWGRIGGGICCFGYSSPTIKKNVITENTAEYGGGVVCIRFCLAIITENTISNNEGEWGAGIYCYLSAAEITYNSFVENSAELSGGAGLSYHSTLTFSNNLVEYNWAGWGSGFQFETGGAVLVESNIVRNNSSSNYGGGLRFYQNSAEIHNNVIMNNWANLGGGGLEFYEAEGTATNNIISGNAASDGAGIFCWTMSTPKIVNCMINDNSAYDDGGGICSAPGCSTTVINCTFSGNTAGLGGGIHCNPNTIITNSILWDNSPNEIEGSPTVSFSNVKGGCPGTGNIDSDPLFIDPSVNDFHLHCLSPCIDAGDNVPGLPAEDFEGDPRIHDGDGDGTAVVDMGADEVYVFHVPIQYPTIQSAIDAAQDAAMVLVAPGTYVENIDFLGKAITVVSQDGYEHTVIEGTRSGSVVTFANGEGPDSVLEGFQVSNGSAVNGGGILCNGASPMLQKNMITGNSATNGGGICCVDASPVLCNNVLCNNQASAGGAILADSDSSPVITNNTLYSNTASSTGGGLDSGNGIPVVTNSIFWQNTAPAGSQIYGTAPSVTYCDVQDGWPGDGNIDADPLFEDPGLYDFHISPESPCINEGDNNAPELPETDLDGDDRIYLIVDMGVDEVLEGITIRVPEHAATIQAAINYAINGITVLVSPGTYKENINFLGKAITVKSSDGADETIIDGRQAGSVVTFANGEGPDSLLEGFQIENGSAMDGGGIFCDGASPTIRYNEIHGNSAPHPARGGGIFCRDSTALIACNSIHDNTAYRGGGIGCGNASPMILNNNIFDNLALFGNGGEGGGIFCTGSLSQPVISNNTITKNSSFFGGGVNSVTDASPVVTNTVLWENQSLFGHEIYVSSTVTISYSDVEGGQSEVFVVSGGTLNWGDGMIDADPIFVDSANNDFHLICNSPCTDTGDNSVVTELCDFEGDPRIAWSGTVDMGADEFYTHLYITGDQTPGGSVQGNLVGIPGTSPVYIIIGFDVFDPPKATIYGDLYLKPPRILIPLFPMPGNGIIAIPTTVPPTPPAPYDVPMQGLVGLNSDSLTNLCVLEVR